MAKVIPAILVKSKKEFKEKVLKVSSFINIVQIDIMDNKFVPNKTWGTPEKVKEALKEIKFKKDFEVHLMVLNPERVIKNWADAGAKRIIFHFESTKKPEEIIKKIKKSKCRVGMAINPETPVKSIENFLKDLDFVLVMGVSPGFSGQRFQSEILKKIKQIKKLKPKISIGVDGGVSLKNAQKIINAGADTLTTASALFKSNNIKKELDKFKLL